MTWAYGPLHSGGEGPTKCLAIGEESDGVSAGVAAGAGIGGLVGGLAVGTVGAFFFFRRRQRSGPYYDGYPSDRIRSYGLNSVGKKSPLETETYEPLPGSASAQEFANVRSNLNLSSTGRYGLPAGTGYEVEPFVVPQNTNSSDEALARGTTVLSSGSGSRSRVENDSASNDNSLRVPSSPERERTRSSSGGQVYVVHHDGGRAPVTVYTSEGAEVIELPPRYDNNSTDSRPRLEQLQERRRLGPRPVKSPSQLSFTPTNS